MTLEAAPIVAWEEADLPFGDGDRLACLYVVVDPKGRPDVGDFLTGYDGCGDVVRCGWQAVRRPKTALVSLELRHACGARPALRLVFDVERDAAAIRRLSETGALVVGSRSWGSFGNAVVAYGVMAAHIEAAAAEATRGLTTLAAALN